MEAKVRSKRPRAMCVGWATSFRREIPLASAMASVRCRPASFDVNGEPIRGWRVLKSPPMNVGSPPALVKISPKSMPPLGRLQMLKRIRVAAVGGG